MPIAYFQLQGYLICSYDTFRQRRGRAANNYGDTYDGDGAGNDVILSGEWDDQSTGNGGRDIFVCGGGEDTVTDYNEEEGDIATADCENINP